MTTDVALANLALGHLGEDASISQLNPPEGSPHAEQAAQFYPVARDALLEMHPWNFATRRVALAELATNPCTRWAHAYALPSNVLAVFGVYEYEAQDDDDVNDFEIETDALGNRVLYTAIADAKIHYTVSVSDVTRFSPLFSTALSFLLAAYLAGPVLKGETGRTVAQAMMQTAMGWLAQARTSDAKQRRNQRTRESHVAPWMSAR